MTLPSIVYTSASRKENYRSLIGGAHNACMRSWLRMISQQGVSIEQAITQYGRFLRIYLCIRLSLMNIVGRRKSELLYTSEARAERENMLQP